MAVKNTKKRVMITLPKKQIEWLEQFCKNHELTISNYISWMLIKKAEEMISVLKIDKSNFNWLEQQQELYEIITTKWIE